MAIKGNGSIEKTDMETLFHDHAVLRHIQKVADEPHPGKRDAKNGGNNRCNLYAREESCIGNRFDQTSKPQGA